MPEKIRKCVDSWYEKCPDYEIINWNFQRLGDNCPIWVRQSFENKKYAFAADWVRAYVLYKFGGIYLDSDVEVVKPFDNLLNNKYFLCFEGHNDIRIEAAVMGAESGMDYFKDLLAYYDGREFVKPDGTFDMYPLPYIMSEIGKGKYSISPITNPSEYKGQIDFNQLRVLPYDYFSPQRGDGKIYLSNNTYAIHHFQGAWQTADFRRKRWLGRKFPHLLRALVITKHLLNGTRPL